MKPKMNTMCNRNPYSCIHQMVEVGLRMPTYKQVSLEPGNHNEPQPIPYTVHMQCVYCGDRGKFNQNNEAIEYHQSPTIHT